MAVVNLVCVKSDFPTLATKQCHKPLVISFFTYLSVYCSFDFCQVWHLHQIASNYRVVSVVWVTYSDEIPKLSGVSKMLSLYTSKHFQKNILTSMTWQDQLVTIAGLIFFPIDFLFYIIVCNSCSKCVART